MKSQFLSSFSLLLVSSALAMSNKHTKNNHFSKDTKAPHRINKKKIKPFFQKSAFDVIPLNSPVKESLAKFRLEVPMEMKIMEVKVKLVNTRDLNKEQKDFSDAKIVNEKELHIPISKLPPGFYRLYVKVKDTSKREHIFRRIFHDFVRFVIDNSLEVPVPDPKVNNMTLGGIDSDNDGIRDDVQRYINENYLGDMNLALKQYAQQVQESLLNSQDKESSNYNSGKLFEVSECLSSIRPTDYHVHRKKIKGIYLNTEARVKKELQMNLWFHGQGLPESIKNFYASGSEDESIFCAFPSGKEKLL